MYYKIEMCLIPRFYLSMYTITTHNAIKYVPYFVKMNTKAQCPSRVEYNHKCHTSPFIGERREACDELLV